jgi:protein TonB
VVDCDNEQNATLLFKSARNSTSNQASLAVAVVEGQAGVAKAFRIGANLVLTKPINIEQAKGTLRVARGLLRKSEPPKPMAPQAPSPSAVAVTTNPAPPPARQAPAAQVATAPVVFTPAKPETRSALPVPAATSKAAQAPLSDDDLLEISTGNSATASSTFTPPSNKFITPAPQADKSLATAVPVAKPNIGSGLPPANRGAAASAPAPARERQDSRATEVLPKPPGATDASSKPVATVPAETSSLSVSAPFAAPSFSFGGANTSSESTGGSKKIFLGIVAAAIIAVAAYAGWAHFQAPSSSPNLTETASNPVSAPAPVAIPQTTKPSKPSPAPTSAKPSATLPSSQTTSSNLKGHAAENGNPAQDELSSSASTKTSKTGSSASKETADATDDSDTPLVVKGGKTPGRHAKVGVADVAAPNIIGIATAGASAPPPDLGSGPTVAPKPVLQTMTVSQGVSRGLLFKKVQPVYPKNALYMRVEGTVELAATISKTGDITHVKVVSGDSELAKAAVTAVKQWKYKPYLLNGEPLEIQTQITINFKLPN